MPIPCKFTKKVKKSLAIPKHISILYTIRGGHHRIERVNRNADSMKGEIIITVDAYVRKQLNIEYHTGRCESAYFFIFIQYHMIQTSIAVETAQETEQPTDREIHSYNGNMKILADRREEHKKLSMKADKDVFERGRMMMCSAEYRNAMYRVDTFEKKYPQYFESEQERKDYDDTHSLCCDAPIVLGIRCSKCKESI